MPKMHPSNGFRTPAERLLLLVVPPEVPHREIAVLLKAAGKAIDPGRWRVESLYLHPDHLARGAAACAETLINRKPAGIVWLFADPAAREVICCLAGSGLPIVTYDRDFSSVGALGVLADAADVAQGLFEQLWQLGKRRFALLAADRPYCPVFARFRQVVADLAAERGVIADFRQLLLPFDGNEQPGQDMNQAIGQLMDRPDRPEAILCGDVYSLAGLKLWLTIHRGVRVPQDLAVASLGRVTHPNLLRLLPAIPSGEIDHVTMMRTAASMVEERLAGLLTPPTVRSIPAKLIRIA